MSRRIGRRKAILIPTALMMGLLMVLSFGGFAGATDTSGSGVAPILVEGNPSCATLNADDTAFPTINSDFGFKVEGDYNRTVPMDGNATGTSLVGGAPPDLVNEITMVSADGVYFDWASTLGLDAVIAKGGSDGNAYVYSPEAFADTNLHSPINPSNGLPYEISHIEFCYDYELGVDKDAAGSYDRTITWELTKSVSPNAHIGFIGDSFSSAWTVVATKSVAEDNYQVTGNIYVDNPSPIAVDFSVADVIDGSIGAAVECPSYTAPANGSITCTYSAVEADGIDGTQTSNVVTVTSLTDGVDGGSATADILFTANVIGDESVTIDDDRNPGGFPTSISDTTSFTYDEPLSCSTNTDDYTNGVDSDNYLNTATATGTYTNLSASADVDVTCYIPSISKDAAGTYDERHEWGVTKTVDPTSQSGFAGDTVFFDWTITVDETVVEENFDVAGTITVGNPNPDDALVVSLVDWVNGHAATVDESSCAYVESTGLLTVVAGGSETCHYTAALPDEDDVDLAPDTNTATITLNGIEFDATDPIEYTKTVIRGSATLDDDQFPYSGESVWDGWTSTYDDSYTCSSDLNDYTDGADLDNQVLNTAEVYSEGALQDDSMATAEIDCFIPSISKTAAGTYDERHAWDVEKTVTPLTNSGYPGDTLGWTWTIDVFEDVYEENFDVAGTITVNNPNPEDALVVPLTDVLNGDIATITGCTGIGVSFVAPTLTVPADGTATCSYTANDLPYSDVDLAPDLNTATITLNGIDFTATDPIEYTANVIRGSATLSDDEIGLIDESVSGGDQFTGSDSVTCSTDRSVYGEDWVYEGGLTNWAYLTDSEGTVYSDDATTEWLCEASFVDVLKTTNGDVDPTKDIRFKLFDGDGVDLDDEVSTFDDEDGQLQFQTALVPGDPYTVCESPVPAGYTFEITVDGGIVLTYAGPPGAVDPTGEIQCFDFVAPAAGSTVLFEVNNSFPGGAPRTPGYWKNWNTCSGGNQVATAFALGGVVEGVFLLDDLLPQTVGNFDVATCEVGVYVLSAQQVAGNKVGKNASNDGAYLLARNLLAARLNQDAGACDPDGPDDHWTIRGEESGIFVEATFEQLLTESDAFLAEVGFNGEGSFLGPKDKKAADDRTYALYLAGIIDDYNNGEICTGDPSH